MELQALTHPLASSLVTIICAPPLDLVYLTWWTPGPLVAQRLPSAHAVCRPEVWVLPSPVSTQHLPCYQGLQCVSTQSSELLCFTALSGLEGWSAADSCSPSVMLRRAGTACLRNSDHCPLAPSPTKLTPIKSCHLMLSLTFLVSPTRWCSVYLTQYLTSSGQVPWLSSGGYITHVTQATPEQLYTGRQGPQAHKSLDLPQRSFPSEI